MNNRSGFPKAFTRNYFQGAMMGLFIAFIILSPCRAMANAGMFKPASALKQAPVVDAVTGGAPHRYFDEKNIIQAAKALLVRVLGKRAVDFSLEVMPSTDGKDVFEIAGGGKGGRVVLRGSSPVAIASALNWYLKYYAHQSLSWCGDQLNLPASLPPVGTPVHIETPYQHRVYLNYCTFNYSMAWWDWKRWEREIDWMAMHGINMVLSVTGQEAVWQRTLRQYKMTDEEIRSFLVGPAYFAWQWMTNIESIHGPLPQQWIDRSIELEKKILARERELAITPILQGFTGYVPIALIKKYPDAHIQKKPVWFHVGPGTAQLDPLDPLFAKLTRTFLQEQQQLYGTSHYYAADPFHEGTPPKPGEDYLKQVGRKIWESTAAVDSAAHIVMQSWSIRAPVAGQIPKDRLLVLDLNSSKWKGSGAFWGSSWVGGVIHNFGGNTALGGDLDAVIRRFPTLLNEPEKTGQFTGIGIFPEAIIQNPVIYDAALEMAWYKKSPDTQKWLTGYLESHYGEVPLSRPVQAAWDTLLQTAYGKKGGIVTRRESSIIARPSLKVYGASPNGSLNSEKNYRFASLWEAVKLLMQAPATVRQTDTYKYDLVDVMRQCLADLGIKVQQKMAEGYEAGDQKVFARYSKSFLDLMDDLDLLLGSRKEFLLGKWIHDARSIGATKAEKKLYEQNARSLITIWGPYDDEAIQYDYSARQWNGMIRTFYKVRWQKYIDMLTAELKKDPSVRYKEENVFNRYKRPGNTANEFYRKLARWEVDWTRSHDASLRVTPSGNEIILVERYYNKWLPVMKELEK